MRRRFFRKTRSERGAGQCQARNERRTKLLRKKIQQARPIHLNRSGLDGTIQLGRSCLLDLLPRSRPSQLTRPGWGEGMRRRVGKPAPLFADREGIGSGGPGAWVFVQAFLEGRPWMKGLGKGRALRHGLIA